MECLIQYLDELEDYFYAMALLRERFLRALRTILVLGVAVLCQISGVLLALSRPPLALAVVCLAMVGMLYRAVTTPAAVTRPG
ncbi:MAG: hypothetical protein ACREQZ_13035 [Woeseiaceae bacterium]